MESEEKSGGDELTGTEEVNFCPSLSLGVDVQVADHNMRSSSSTDDLSARKEEEIGEISSSHIMVRQIANPASFFRLALCSLPSDVGESSDARPWVWLEQRGATSQRR